jgi:hypothetical protein
LIVLFAVTNSTSNATGLVAPPGRGRLSAWVNSEPQAHASPTPSNGVVGPGLALVLNSTAVAPQRATVIFAAGWRAL